MYWAHFLWRPSYLLFLVLYLITRLTLTSLTVKTLSVSHSIFIHPLGGCLYGHWAVFLLWWWEVGGICILEKNICAHFLWPFYLVFLQMTKNLKKNCKYLIWKWLIQQWRFYKNNLDVSLIDVVCITIFKLTRPINFSSPYLYDEIMKQHPSFANGHTTLNAPLLVRSAKLSNVGSGQYLDGWPPGNTRCCWLFFSMN